MNDIKSIILAKAKAIEPQIIADRRHLHQNPEYGMELPETVNYLRSRLESIGYTVNDCGGGLTACIGKDGGKTLLIRADMDALKVVEDNDLPFRSTNGKGHMCGHDLHMSMLLGVAEILKSQEDSLEGQVKLMFQPGEEILTGAKAMVDDGVLENPKVDAAFSLHVLTNEENGKFQLKKGNAFSSMDVVKVKVYGKGSHGSAPEAGIDPIHALVQMYNGLTGLTARESSMFAPAVFTIGMFNGGDMPNVIPGTAEMGGSLRCFDAQIRRRLQDRIRAVVESVSAGLGVTCELSIEGVESVYNDPAFCDEIIPFLQEMNGENFEVVDAPKSFSEDFSEISERVPSAYMTVGVGSPSGVALHNPKAFFNEDKMYQITATVAYTAMKWLEKNK